MPNGSSAGSASSGSDRRRRVPKHPGRAQERTEKKNDHARGSEPERKKKRGGEEPQRGERLTAAALRERERKRRAEAPRSPVRESSEAGGRPSELPPVRAGCGPGGGPVCWVDRQRGGTGEEVDSYPTELEVLGLRDQWISFAPETVKKLTYDD